MAISDAAVATFYTKYLYKVWRPETAIHEGALDGNDKTDWDPAFKPFIVSPCFPGYPSAHGTLGNAARNILLGPPLSTVNLTLSKTFSITERAKLQFRSDFVNAFNHVQLDAPNMSLGSTMGQITSAQPPRYIQLALKLYY